MKKTSAAKNYLYNTSYKVLTLLTPLITAPYLARVIGSEGVGVFSFTYAIAYNFMLVAKLGLINYGSRSIARVRDDEKQLSKTFSEIYRLQVITSLAATLLYYAFVELCISDHKTICLLNGLYVLSICIDIDWLFYGLEQFRMTSIRNAVVKILTVVSILVFVRKENGLMVYVIIMIASDIIKFLSIWISFRKCTSFVKTRLKDVFCHLKPSLILFVPVIATSIYRSMDKIMLGALSTMTETGLYENSEKIVYMLLGFVTSLEMVMMPRISNMLQRGNKEEAFKNIKYSMTFVVALTSAMAFGISGITDRFIPMFYGEEFIGCSELLPPLAITLIFIGWANVIRTQYIMPNGKDHVYVISTIIGAIINLVVNWICIPLFNAKGAVIGTIAAELSVAIYLSIIVRKELPVFQYLKSTIAFPLIGIVMWIGVDWLGTQFDNVILSLVIQITCGGMSYVVLSLVIIRLFQPQLWNILTKIVSGKRRISK